MTVTIRPYQAEAIRAVIQDWEAGYTDVLGTMATGGGKSLVFLAILNQVLTDGRRGLVLAHRKELIDQPLARLFDYFPAWSEWIPDGTSKRRRAGVVMADQDEPSCQLIVATVQTLSSPARLERILSFGPIDYLVTDECFVAGTLVDGRPIETIQTGDVVSAWDEKKQQITVGTVTRTFKRKAMGSLVKITAGSHEIVCTYNHPILTTAGWQPAINLNTEDFVYVSHFNLSLVQETIRNIVEVEKRSSTTNRENLLLSRMRSGVCSAEIIGNDGSDQSEVCQPTHESQQPDDKSGQPGENAQRDQKDVSEWLSGNTSGQWIVYEAANGASESTWLGHGSSNTDRLQRTRRNGISELLQGGYWKSGAKDCHRSRRKEPQTSGETHRRCEENGFIEFTRVDRVKVLERGSDREYKRLCPDGYVYNLEVDRCHTYTANGFVVHNCHHAPAATYRAVYDRLRAANPEMRHLGVTATPIRADGDGLAGVYQKESFHFGIVELIKAGYLAPVRWLAIQTAISLKGVQTSGGDFVVKQLADVYETDNCFELVVESHKKYANGRQAVAFTVTVEGAYALAEKFNDAGILASAADGTTAKKLRSQILDDFSAGRTAVLCNVGLYTEGLDVPAASCIHQVRPTKSDGLYCQMVGRALRIYPGKNDALILDYAPLEDRNIAMMGDVLGCPLKRKDLVEETTEPGLVQGGFTFDGKFTLMDGSPAEIISRQLDYLHLSPWCWFRRDGWLTLGLGKGSDEIERILAISPAVDGRMTLYGVAKRDRRWSARELQAGEFEQLSEVAEQIANKRGDAALAAKSRAWRMQSPSEAQVQFARRLGAYKKEYSKGELAQAITHALATHALRAVQEGAIGG